MERTRRNNEDDRGSRDRGGSSRGDDRGSRDRDDRGRDDRGGRDRGGDDRGSRDRDDRGRDRDDRGSSRSSTYEYQRRSADDVRERATENSKFDKYLAGALKMFKANDGENRTRVLPPTWPGAKHYGVDIWVHYGVGADSQTYLCPRKHKKGECPICEERERFAKDADTDNADDKQYLKDLDAKQRVLCYVVDRDHERDGVQAWAMPEGLDRDFVKISVDRDTGEVLPVDHPEDGYDLIFDKSGSGMKTKYEAPSISRRPSPLGRREWMEFAVENPLPDQLIFYEYDHLARAFGGGSGPGHSDRRDDRGGRDRDDRGGRDDRGSSRDRDDRGGRDDRGSSGRDRDDRGGRDRDDRGRDDRGDGRSRNEKPEYTWVIVHDMRVRELEDLIESEKLNIDPKEAKDDEDLADWVCEEMGLKKEEERRGGRDRDDRGTDDRMASLRTRLKD